MVSGDVYRKRYSQMQGKSKSPIRRTITNNGMIQDMPYGK